jgi:HSP20 family molecular chaperone IbpA
MQTYDYFYRPNTFKSLFDYFDFGFNDGKEEGQWNEKDGVLTGYVDIPGVKEEDINLQTANNKLLLSFVRKNPPGSKAMTFSWFIGNKYDLEEVKATLTDGVLKLEIPIRKTLPSCKGIKVLKT